MSAIEQAPIFNPETEHDAPSDEETQRRLALIALDDFEDENPNIILGID